ncbi:ABC-2 family transporter protein [Anaerobranca californiensis DSM 14826]|uniref:ABC-2 family transporter protein n=1 Tax=Anaerobranca californiensis DSM 14826 TaxID=1120989 RepID=A0A1M6LAN7_9FIRM|nr:ABC transporter permease subunit [Anaerobranca californiensis]SHJ68222.1 ABC-2 family transporter protein [Anaerobranca californiensis DSM 14826]
MKLKLNPILTNESRLKMRNWRTFVLVAVYLTILGGLGIMFFATNYWSFQYGGVDLAQIGRNLFVFLSIIQFLMIYFIVPGFTSNSITYERERQTFDLLVCTQLTPMKIISGKLLAALNNVVLLIFASLPIYGLVFLLGGVTLGELVKLVLIYLYTAFVYGGYYTFISSKFKKSQPAVIISYVISLMFLGLTMIIASIIAVLFQARNLPLPFPYILLLNPGSMAEFLYPEVREFFNSISGGKYPFSGVFQGVKFWMLSGGINIVLSGLCLYWASREVNPLRQSKRSG